MVLSAQFKNVLKGKAHSLSPVVWIGQNGYTPAILREIEAALTAHELIKVRIQQADRKQRQTIIHEISAQSDAELVQCIGAIAVFYRPSQK